MRVRAIAGLGTQPKQSEICVSCFFARLFDTNSRVLVLCVPTITTHSTPIFLARSFWWCRSTHSLSLPLSLSLSHFLHRSVEPLVPLLLKSQSRFNARSFWSCSLPRNKFKQNEKKKKIRTQSGIPNGTKNVLGVKKGAAYLCARVCVCVRLSLCLFRLPS